MFKAADFLPVLSELNSNPVSGEALAKRLRLSRTAVWKKIHTLQKMGFPIRTLTRRGYIFDGTADFSLAALHFSDALKPWAQPHYELTTTSTQDLALHAARSGIPEGHFWLSELQTQGRGRLDRPWSSGFGGLWFSLVLRPQIPPSKAASIGLVAALSLVHALENVVHVKAWLKWPNDLVVGGLGRGDAWGKGFKKVAGFLTQMSGEMDRTEWIVLGVGLNVFNAIPAELKQTAMALKDVNMGPDVRQSKGLRAELLKGFFEDFYPAYRDWQRKGFANFQMEYWKRYSRPDQSCTLKTANGEIRGIARGVDASGAIIIESRRKKQVVLEGEIVL